MHPFEAPTFSAWRRGLLRRRFTWADALVVALVGYVVVVTFMRFFWSFFPWTMEGDWKQWIWQYHRYFTDGAFPPGHVITDYQFRVQPPFYWLTMSALSHVVHPGVAARLLAFLAWGLALWGTFRATTRLSHWLMGLTAVVFLTHDFHIFITTTGGYPRSFGIGLVLLILDAWIARKHGRVLALLVLTAGLYPSVLPPCGLAYGVWTSIAALREGPRAVAWKVGTLVVTAAACAGIALSQNFLALDWWGPVISYEEAEQLEALHAGGRMRWVPHGGFFENVFHWGLQPWEPSGALALYELIPWPSWVPRVVGALLAVSLAVVALVRRRAGAAVRFPWEVCALIAGALVTYFAARELAFRLYLPVRVLQHVAPVCVMVLVPALAWQACRSLVEEVRALRLAVALTLAPVFLLGGDGFLFPGWGDYGHRQKELSWIEENTPVDALFAGDIATCDLIPFFSARQVYVNWTMAHPFRLGYWAEMERRLRAIHDVMYAADVRTVVKFIDTEKVDYLVLDRARFKEPDTGRKLFHPLRNDVLALWQKRMKQGFVLEKPPAEAVVYDDGEIVVIDAKKLRAAWTGAR